MLFFSLSISLVFRWAPCLFFCILYRLQLQLELLTRKQLLNLRFFFVHLWYFSLYIVRSAYQTIGRFIDHALKQTNRGSSPFANHLRKQQTCRYIEHYHQCEDSIFIFSFSILSFSFSIMSATISHNFYLEEHIAADRFFQQWFPNENNIESKKFITLFYLREVTGSSLATTFPSCIPTNLFAHFEYKWTCSRLQSDPAITTWKWKKFIEMELMKNYSEKEFDYKLKTKTVVWFAWV